MKFTGRILVLALLGAGLFLMSGCCCLSQTPAVPDTVSPDIEAPPAG